MLFKILLDPFKTLERNFFRIWRIAMSLQGYLNITQDLFRLIKTLENFL